MLLIMALGLIANLALVCGDCDIGTPKLNDFDLYKFSGNRPWYWRMHELSDLEDNFDCPASTFAFSEETPILFTTHLYNISEQRYMTYNGLVTNWNTTGYIEIDHYVESWNGRYYVVAVDYEGYMIFKGCPFITNQLTVYVAYRSICPDKDTVEDLLDALKDNDIDVSQLVDWPADHCGQAESSHEDGSE